MKGAPVAGFLGVAFTLRLAAVDFVVGMLHRNERGVPVVPHRLLIDGVWIEGTTVRPRPAGTVAAAETPSCP